VAVVAGWRALVTGGGGGGLAGSYSISPGPQLSAVFLNGLFERQSEGKLRLESWRAVFRFYW
jgi:hypothetical protein